jgi:hypothetical protein
MSTEPGLLAGEISYHFRLGTLDVADLAADSNASFFHGGEK